MTKTRVCGAACSAFLPAMFCLSWPTIRTKGEYRDLAMHVDILRAKSPTTNWAGIGLRAKATGARFGDSIRVVVLQGRGGDRTELVVQPMERR